jgi:hypothetical protein
VRALVVLAARAVLVPAVLRVGWARGHAVLGEQLVVAANVVAVYVISGTVRAIVLVAAHVVAVGVHKGVE